MSMHLLLHVAKETCALDTPIENQRLKSGNAKFLSATNCPRLPIICVLGSTALISATNCSFSLSFSLGPSSKIFLYLSQFARIKCVTRKFFFLRRNKNRWPLNQNRIHLVRHRLNFTLRYKK